MRIATRSTQKKLFKVRTKPIPSYDTFMQLLELHNYEIDKPLLMTCGSPVYRIVLYSLRSSIKAITNEANYNILVNNEATLSDYIQQVCSKQSYKAREAFRLFMNDIGSISYAEIARKLVCAPRSVHRWIDNSCEAIKDRIYVNLFKTYRNTIDEFLVNYPISDKTISKMDTVLCKKFTELPMDAKLKVYPYIFTRVPYKCALGSRILLEGGSHEEVYEMRIHYGLDCADDKPKHNFKHNKQSFMKYLKKHSQRIYNELNATL